MTHVSTETFTTGRMVPSGTNNLSAEVSIQAEHWLLTMIPRGLTVADLEVGVRGVRPPKIRKAYVIKR